jgi:hypothetical protein
VLRDEKAEEKHSSHPNTYIIEGSKSKVFQSTITHNFRNCGEGRWGKHYK